MYISNILSLSLCLVFASDLGPSLVGFAIFCKADNVVLIETFWIPRRISENVTASSIYHGLRTPNEGLNQRYLTNWADVADKICCPHT